MYKKHNLLVWTMFVSLLVAVIGYVLLVSIYGCPPCPDGFRCEPCPRSPSLFTLVGYFTVILLSILTFLSSLAVFLVRAVNERGIKNKKNDKPSRKTKS